MPHKAGYAMGDNMKQKLLEALRKSNNRKLEGMWKQVKVQQIQRVQTRKQA